MTEQHRFGDLDEALCFCEDALLVKYKVEAEGNPSQTDASGYDPRKGATDLVFFMPSKDNHVNILCYWSIGISRTDCTS